MQTQKNLQPLLNCGGFRSSYKDNKMAGYDNTMTYERIVAERQLSGDEMRKELIAVWKYQPRCEGHYGDGRSLWVQANSFIGNKLIYHFQMDELCKTARKGRKSLYEHMNDPILKEKLLRDAARSTRTGSYEQRIFEWWRRLGCVAAFKTCSASYLYHKYNARSILDPCAGWGGRLLGAIHDGRNYIGFDTNLNLKKGYDDMMAEYHAISHLSEGRWDATMKPIGDIKMRWESSLDADFTGLEYDMVLTSPPYENLEMYSHMPEFATEKAFYEDFLIRLINKCIHHCKQGGIVCFNISPEMYDKLTKKYKFRTADEEIPLLEQKNGKKPDMTYAWRA